MDPIRTVISADGDIVGNLTFIIHRERAMPCLHVRDGQTERLLLIPWKKLRLAGELFVLRMTRAELLESGFPEMPPPERAMLAELTVVPEPGVEPGRALRPKGF